MTRHRVTLNRGITMPTNIRHAQLSKGKDGCVYCPRNTMNLNVLLCRSRVIDTLQNDTLSNCLNKRYLQINIHQSKNKININNLWVDILLSICCVPARKTNKSPWNCSIIIVFYFHVAQNRSKGNSTNLCHRYLKLKKPNQKQGGKRELCIKFPLIARYG